MRHQFAACILLAVFISAIVGCATSGRSPMDGWLQIYGEEGQNVKVATKDDYQDYIQKLPAKERQFINGGVSFYKNTLGQHAVLISVPYYGVWRNHVLIYDKDNKRMKTITFNGGRYRS